MLRLAPLALPLLAASASGIQSASNLLVDLNPTPSALEGLNSGVSSGATVLGTALGRLWVKAGKAGHTSDLWSLAGPDSPPVLWTLGDNGSWIIRSQQIAELSPEQMLVSLDTFLSPHLTGTFVTDGTSGNAVQLFNLPFDEALVEDGVAYLLFEGDSGTRLVRTEGTLESTQSLGTIQDDLISATVNGSERRLFRAGEALVYSLATLADGVRVFAQPMNGGPRIKLVETAGTPVLGAFSAAESGNELLFTTHTADTGTGRLWITDGTVPGTNVLVDYEAEPLGARVVLMATDGQRAVFRADSTGLGRELHLSDGTAAGTSLVVALGNDPVADNPVSAVPAGSGFVFTYRSLVAEGVYYTDGTAEGTTRVSPPGFEFGPSVWNADSILHTLPGGVGFMEIVSSTEERLWFTDTTASGTFPLTGSTFRSIRTPAGFADEIWFSSETQYPADVGRELFRATSEPFSSVLAHNFAVPEETQSSLKSDSLSGPENLLAAPGQVWFEAFADNGSNLTVSDGTPEGTRLLAPVRRIRSMGVAFRNGVLFSADSSSPSSPLGDIGSEPWFSDGTTEGTVLLGDLKPGQGSSVYNLNGRCAVLGDRILFTTYGIPFAGKSALWSTDGTPQGTQPVTKLPPNQPDLSTVGFLARAGERVLFTLLAIEEGNPDSKLGLWSTDGTHEGTVPVVLLPENFKGSRVVATIGQRVLFILQTGSSDDPWALWVTDGTPEGTLELDEFRPTSSIDPNLRRLDDRWVLLTLDRITVIDLDDNSTQAVFEPWLENYEISRVSYGEGGLAYFCLSPAEAGSDALEAGLWVTDGTADGTRFVTKVATSSQVMGSDGRALIFNSMADTGSEPWITDGTPEGTQPLEESLPGIMGSVSSTGGARAGDSIIYRGYDMVAGREPHVISLSRSGSYVTEPFGLRCADATFDVQGELRIGATVDLTVAKAAPLSTTRLYVSSATTDSPLGTCTLYLENPAPLVDLTADAEGAARLPFTVPDDPALVGTVLYLQGANLTAGGGFGGIANLTNAVELVFGQ